MQNNTPKANAFFELERQLNYALTLKAKHDFEEERTFYPPRDGWEEWEWHNEETGETYTQEEARIHIEDKITEMLEEITPTLVQTAMDNLPLD